MLGAIRMARAPEPKKKTLKEMLAAEVAAILQRQRNLALVKIVDGAADNWQFVASDALPNGEQVVDFFYASEHVHAAIADAYRDGTHEAQYRYATLRDTRCSRRRRGQTAKEPAS